MVEVKLKKSLPRRLCRCLRNTLYYSLCCCLVPHKTLSKGFFAVFPCLQKKVPWTGDEVTIKTFAMLQLSRDDCIKLHKAFQEIDDDGSGHIDVSEFLNYVDVDPTPFSKRVFSIMDEDGSGEMDFREFVVACWNYCSFEKSGLIFFTYDLYDADRNGTRSVKECQAMFVEVYGEDFAQANKGLKLFEKIELIATSHERTFDIITRKQFIDLVNSHVNVLMPAYQMQSAIQSKVLGKKFWNKITSRRLRNMGADEWVKQTHGNAKKIDTHAVLKGYREQQAKEMLERLKNNYRSSLIGRLGKYNPELDTERRTNMHYKTKDMNFGNFEDLHYMLNKSVLPKVLEREPAPGHFFLEHIAQDEFANRPHWDRDVPGVHRSVESVLDQTKELKKWHQDHVEAKEINTFKDGAPEGYKYKGNITQGPIVKIHVDQSNKVIDWNKANVKIFTTSVDSSLESGSIEKMGPKAKG